MIYQNILETIGNTPIVKINRLNNTKANIYVKVESFNPGKSIKDRVAYQMILDGLDNKTINQETTIIEPTSGNTGVGLAMVCASLNMKLIIVMPESMSLERRNLIQGYGAKLILTDSNLGMQGSIDKANQLQQEINNSIVLQQFENKSNPNAHYKTTAKEIFTDLDVDVFVSGIGTGGTISGVGRYLKERKKDVLVYGVEPLSSNILNGGKASSHAIQGIGANFIPKNLDQSVVDGYIDVKDEDAFITARALMQVEGIGAGISSGAALWAALSLAKNKEFDNKNIVVILPDTNERYLSTKLY